MVSRRELMIGLLGLVTSGAGVGVQVEATKNYSYDVGKDGKPANVRLDNTSYQLGYDIIKTNEVYKARTGKAKIEVTGVYIDGADGRPMLIGGEVNR